jgi:hypothetical protein
MEGLWPDDLRDDKNEQQSHDFDVDGEGERDQEEEESEEEEYVGCGVGQGEALHDVLPLEVMQHIMGMMDPASVGRSECVCRAWRVACHSPYVWEAVYRRHFASRPSDAPQGIFYFIFIFNYNSFIYYKI